MLEKGKISAAQMGIMMYPTVLATAILLVPAITAHIAERDLWLSPIWASATGFLTVYVVYRLNQLYPEKTFIEYCGEIVGKLAGKAIGWVYLAFFLHITGIIIREYGEFMVGTFLNRTPISLVMGTMVLVCAFNVRGGLEVMGRSAQIFVPIVIVLFVCIVILLIPELEPGYMLPVLEHGLWPSFKGSLVLHGWFSEFMLIAFLLPYVTDRKKGRSWALMSVMAIMLTMVITNLASYFLFGESTSKIVYPVMVAARFVSIADFFEHMEALVMMIWVGGTFVKISVFFYAIVLGAAQLLKCSDYKPLTLPIGLLLLMISIWLASSLQQLVHFLSTVSPFYFLTMQTAIPAVLLLIALARKRLAGAKEG